MILLNHLDKHAHDEAVAYPQELAPEPETPVAPVEEEEETEVATLSLNEEQKRKVLQTHRNYGHPSNEEFLRALRLSRAKQSVLRYVRREFQCPACAARSRMPRPSPPASLPRTCRFNETVGIDLFDLELKEGRTAWVCNMICWGTQ